MIKLPKRSARYSVGKEIGGAVYVHRFYESMLPAIAADCRKQIGEDFDYTIVKYSEKAKTVSFIASPDFDVADEPVVGRLATVTFEGIATWRKQRLDPPIYHHKWLFVQDDYTGFDVEVSKERSRLWLQLPDVDRKRIGTKSYWDLHVVPRLCQEGVWLTSQEMAVHLKVSPCDLSHLRTAGYLRYKKRGNTFLYLVQPSGVTR